MADNVGYTPGVGATIAADDIAGVLAQRIKVGWGPDGTLNDADTASGKALPVQLRSSTGEDVIKHEDEASADAHPGLPILVKRKDAPGNDSGTDGDYEFLQASGGLLWVKPVNPFVTCSTDITRPADTTAYTANDTLADSTSSPTSGGFTLSNAARVSGGSGIITDVWINSSNSPATKMQGEIWIFDQAVTAVNDNAVFALSDADSKLFVAVVPFTLADNGNAANSGFHATNLAYGFTCVGSANLRFLVKVKNAYTPANAEVLTVRAKIEQLG